MPKQWPNRKSRLNTTTATQRDRTGNPSTLEIPLNWLKSGIAVLLLPFCFVATQSFLSAFSQTSASTMVIGSAELWFFFIGVLLWLIAFFGLPRPLFIYVLGHELTHAFFVLLCGGKISEFKVRSAGGHIVTNKNNVMISLSPYFVPFYSVMVVGIFGIAGIFVNLSDYHPNSILWNNFGFSWSWVFYIAIGVTWCFHLTFTGWMITKSQPDLKQNGTFFSLIFIYLINLSILCGFLIIISDEVSLIGFIQSVLDNASSLFKSSAQVWRSLIT